MSDNYPPHYKLLILDYGGVYSFEYNLADFDKIMLRTFGKIPNTTEKKNIAKLAHALAANDITAREYVLAVARVMGTLVPETKIFEEATISVTHPPSGAMRQLVRQIKDSKIKVSLLSNMYEFEVLKTKPLGRYEEFDYVSFSCDARMSKSEPKFFQKTISHFRLPPDTVLFVDDMLQYVNTAKSVGITALYADKTVYKSAEQLSQAIKNKLYGN